MYVNLPLSRQSALSGFNMPLLLPGACTALGAASPSRCDSPCAALPRPHQRLPALQVGLSLLPHLMAFTPKSGQPAQGELFEVSCQTAACTCTCTSSLRACPTWQHPCGVAPCCLPCWLSIPRVATQLRGGCLR